MQVLAWERRTQALTPAGMVTRGDVTQRLLAQLATASEAELANLSVVATRELMVLIGANDDLPWIDGARYCAPDPQVATLWLPTTLAPTLPPDLLRRSAAPRAGAGALLLWHDPEQFVPLHAPRSLTPMLRDWFMEQSR
jgi:hypothetical protein